MLFFFYCKSKTVIQICSNHFSNSFFVNANFDLWQWLFKFPWILSIINQLTNFWDFGLARCKQFYCIKFFSTAQGPLFCLPAHAWPSSQAATDTCHSLTLSASVMVRYLLWRIGCQESGIWADHPFFWYNVRFTVLFKTGQIKVWYFMRQHLATFNKNSIHQRQFYGYKMHQNRFCFWPEPIGGVPPDLLVSYRGDTPSQFHFPVNTFGISLSDAVS